MKTLLLVILALAATAASAERMLGRRGAAAAYAPSNVVVRVEALERDCVTVGRLSPKVVCVVGELTSVTARAFATTTVRASAARGEDEEAAVEILPEISRNYDIFLPDDATMRTMLPVSLQAGIAGTECYLATNRIESLPAFVHVREPAPGIVTIKVEGVR